MKSYAVVPFVCATLLAQATPSPVAASLATPAAVMPLASPILALGLPALGGTFQISVQGQGLQGFVAGFPTNQPVPGCPGCLQGVQGNTVLTSVMSVTVPPSTTFVGLTLAFQGFDFAVPACFNAVRLSDTIDVTIR